MALFSSAPPASLARFADRLEAAYRAAPWSPPLLLRVSDGQGRLWSAQAQEDARTGAVDERPFRIASVTKVYLAAAALRLVERDALALGAPLAEFIGPETAELLALGGYDPAAMNLDHLMRHTTGLRDHCSSAPFLDRLRAAPGRVWTRAEQIEIAVGLGGPLAPPGTAFSYSDTGYVILGEVVERASARPLPIAVPDLLGFERLGLRATQFERPGDPGPLEAQYFGEVDARAWHATFDLFGGGGLVSTLADMDLFLHALFGGEVFEKARTLPDLFAAPPTPSDYPDYGHNGLMFRATLGDQDVWAHTGFWGVQAAYLPAEELALTATFNRSPQAGVYGKDELLEDFAASLQGRNCS